jgi:hypothetical protein
VNFEEVTVGCRACRRSANSPGFLADQPFSDLHGVDYSVFAKGLLRIYGIKTVRLHMHFMWRDERSFENWSPVMVKALKLSIWTAAISSASMGQPGASSYAAVIPMIAPLLRSLSGSIW